MDRILTASIARQRMEIPALRETAEENRNSSRDGRRSCSRGLD
jgi:hypothetical protein